MTLDVSLNNLDLIELDSMEDLVAFFLLEAVLVRLFLSEAGFRRFRLEQGFGDLRLDYLIPVKLLRFHFLRCHFHIAESRLELAL